MIPGTYHTYLSAGNAYDEDGAALQYPAEMLNTLTAMSRLPQHRLKLKKRFTFMLPCNLDLSNGHVSVSIYTVKDLKSNVLFL